MLSASGNLMRHGRAMVTNNNEVVKATQAFQSSNSRHPINFANYRLRVIAQCG